MSGSILEFSQDLTNAEQPPPLPVGIYTATIVSVQKRVSNTSGKEYLNIGLRVPPEAYPADYPDGDPEGTMLFYNRVQTADTGNNRFALKRLCLAIGAPLGSRIDLLSWIDLTCNVEITHQEYEGEMRAQISKVMPA